MKTFSFLLATITGTALAAGAAVAPVHAAALGGTWSGGGYVKPGEGQRENVRCRVTYDRQSSKVYGVRATCASSGNSIRQTGEVLFIRPGRFAGDFYNQQFDVGGRITVSVRGSRQTVTFSGSGVSGRLTLSKR